MQCEPRIVPFKTAFFTIIFLLITGCVSYVPQNLCQTVNFYAPRAETRLKPYFNRAHVTYPPQQVTLLIFKQEKKLELWAKEGRGPVFIRSYPILAASGGAGPKLREGDDQVPEGFYRILSENPHSHYHLSLYLNYPNEWDVKHARADNRMGNLGNDIFIHGNRVSLGCIAIGDSAIEELFVLVYKVGLDNVNVIIAPDDLRIKRPPRVNHAPYWLPGLYSQIRKELMFY